MASTTAPSVVVAVELVDDERSVTGADEFLYERLVAACRIDSSPVRWMVTRAIVAGSRYATPADEQTGPEDATETTAFHGGRR